MVAIKLAVLAFDHEPLFFLGDSETYLRSALDAGYLPSDRSFVYGPVLIKPLLYLFGTLKALVVAQALASAGSALLLAAVLDIGFKAGRPVAALAALVYAVEPLALFYERMVMTESVALLDVAAFVFVGILYLRGPSLTLLAASAFLSIAIAAMRLSFLPAAIAGTLALPLLASWSELAGMRPAELLRKPLAHLLSAVVLLIGFHGAYIGLYGAVMDEPPAYTNADGLFLLASWAPLATGADFPEPGLYDQVVAQPGPPIQDRFRRPQQRWSADGLIARIAASQPDALTTNAVAKQIAVRIVRRDTAGVLALGWATYLDCWSGPLVAKAIATGQGDRELSASMLAAFRTQFGEDLAGRHLLRTPIKAWHGAATIWYRILTLAPLIGLLAFAIYPQRWREMLILGLWVCGLLAVHCLLVTEVEIRYLHGLAWFVVLLLALIAGELARRLARLLRS